MYSRLRGFHADIDLGVWSVDTAERQGYTAGQTSAGVTGGDLCLIMRYAVRQREGESAEEERERAREDDGSVDISVPPALRDPSDGNDRRGKRRGLDVANGEPAEPVPRTSTGFIKPRL